MTDRRTSDRRGRARPGAAVPWRALLPVLLACGLLLPAGVAAASGPSLATVERAWRDVDDDASKHVLRDTAVPACVAVSSRRKIARTAFGDAEAATAPAALAAAGPGRAAAADAPIAGRIVVPRRAHRTRGPPIV